MCSNYKKRVGFDIKVSFKYRGLGDNKDCKGHINFVQLSCDGDEEVNFCVFFLLTPFLVQDKNERRGQQKGNCEDNLQKYAEIHRKTERSPQNDQGFLIKIWTISSGLFLLKL